MDQKTNVTKQKQIDLLKQSIVLQTMSDKESQLELADIYRELADRNFRQSQYDESSRLYTLALNIYRKQKINIGIVKCQNAQASIHLSKGELSVAENKLISLLEFLQKYPDINFEHIVLNNLGIVFEKTGNLTKAVLYYHRSLAIKKELGEPSLLTYTLHNLANIYLQIENYELSLKYNKMALDIIINQKDYFAQTTIINCIAQTLEKKSHFSLAKNTYIRAYKIANKVKNKSQIADSQSGLGRLEFYKGNNAKALKLLNKALLSYRALNEKEHIARCLIDLAKINQNVNIQNAIKQVKEASDICKTNGFQKMLTSIYLLSANLKAFQNNYRKAYFYQKLHIELYKERNKINVINQIEVNKLSVELAHSKTKSQTLEEQAELLKHDSMHDPLTGAGNRRKLDRVLLESWNSQGSDCHLAMLDLDNFKKINDDFSHEIGDIVLKNISEIISNSLREQDKFFRYGGEEFIILLIGIDRKSAIKIYSHIREHILKHNWETIHKNLLVTATLGMVSFTEQSNIEKVLQIADERMYKGKESGKNILVFE